MTQSTQDSDGRLGVLLVVSGHFEVQLQGLTVVAPLLSVTDLIHRVRYSFPPALMGSSPIV